MSTNMITSEAQVFVDTTPALVTGSPGAPILVVCDALGPDVKAMQAFRSGQTMTEDALTMFRRFAMSNGFGKEDFAFVRLCEPMSESTVKTDKRKWDHVSPYVERVRTAVAAHNPKLVVTLGALASRVMIGRAVQITKARGQVEDVGGVPVMPMLSPGFVLRVPEHETTFNSDFLTLSKLKANGWSVTGMVKTVTDYQWRADISDFLGANAPKMIGVDTETTGLRWYMPEVFPFLFQFSPRPGQALCIPIHERYWEKVFPGVPFSAMYDVIEQIAQLVDDPSVKMIGHNTKFDHHMLTKVRRRNGQFIRPRGWSNDTQIMAFDVNENMMQLALSECVRTWVPEMAGYSDEFDATIDKARMIEVQPEIMLPYAGGDPDAVVRLGVELQKLLKRDAKQNACYRRIQMPALAMYREVTEKYGVRVDQCRLRTLGEELDEFTKTEYKKLIRQVPGAIRRLHMDKGLKFSRDNFVRDILFHKDGFGLKPQVFTKSTSDLKGAERIPSVSTKDHLPYFVTDPKAGQWVLDFTEFQKADKLKTTYVGIDANDPDSKTGFWKYIDGLGEIHPSFSMTGTNTGRTNSRDPNGQNFPKRSRWAKAYLSIFKPRPGYIFAASDLSQVELRLAAWMANEPEMLRVYRGGGDIHATTAATAMGIDEAVFAAWKKDQRKLIECANEIPGSGAYLQTLNPGKRNTATVADFYKIQRYRAKAVNFGFIYGAQASTFRTYAKTQYGVDYTEQEAITIRDRYFSRYGKLIEWHNAMKSIAQKHGYVRAIHGAARHLPSIRSQDRGIVSSSERQAINAPIQRFGSDLCLIGAVRFQAQVDPMIARVVLTIHDQVILEVVEGREEEMIRVLCWAMQNPPLEKWFGVTCPIPLGSDAEIGSESLGEMEERTDLEAMKPEWWNEDEDAVIKAFTNGDPMYSVCNRVQPEPAYVYA